MLELMIIMAGALPFLLGMMAFKRIRKRKDAGSDDMPPPPDPLPPIPVMPMTPEGRRSHRPVRHQMSRESVRHASLQTSGWKHRVHCHR